MSKNRTVFFFLNQFYFILSFYFFSQVISVNILACLDLWRMILFCDSDWFVPWH